MTRFQLLGPLSIVAGSDSVVLPPSKPTILLATLLLHANGVVSADYLQEAIWGEEQPATAKAALQTCVMRLRQLFARHGVTQTPIEAVPGGYRITAGTRSLDLIGFREQVRRAAAAAEPEIELYMLKDALSLWQGPLLANVPSDILRRDEVPRLTEERLRTVERVCDLELMLGRCGDVLVELWSVTRTHPGHERFHEQLIEALYRTGRQSEALAEYRRVKTYLLDELGVDPSPSLQHLERAILRGERLGPPDVGHRGAGHRGVGHPGVGHPGAGHPNVEHRETVRAATPHHASPMLPVPLVPSFTGRSIEIDAMVERLRTPCDQAVILVVSGAPGIGKSALAHHVAHLVRDSFPAGQVLVPMGRAEGIPRTAAETAADVVTALRDRRTSGRLLLILDDVADAEQVRPLLPVGPEGAVIVTSRMGLASLIATHGGWVHRLSTFDEEESHQLLRALLGAQRVEREPEAARELAELCGHFPLALRIIAARLLTRPALRLAEAVRWLTDDPLARLSLTDSPAISVERVFGGALDRLDPRLADAFSGLGSISVGLLHAQDVAAELELGAVEVDEVLELLADAGFLEDGPPGPYRMHRLMHMYARKIAKRTRSTQKV
ncbi:BTAD domain-containing putative transcriptional regulator [Sphaerimonospora cavernae]|uniref:BTAD domain-containing putative transcriptional regulator n=1 Tax=Sphaerimonospora cavernae TaxID=1740611 RepID=A0ABV6UAI1_9ACTN